MAWRNIWRNPRRTVLTICAIAFACLLLVFMLSFQFGSYETMINASVKIFTGHIQVQAVGYHEKQEMQSVVPEPLSIGQILENTESVEAYSFRAQAFALISSNERTYGTIVTGVDPVLEAGVSRIKNLMREGSYLSGNDYNQALIGRLLAQNLRVKVGEDLTILGQGRDGSIAATVVTIKGIFSSGIDEFDRASIYIPLKSFQDTFSMQGAVHQVVVVASRLSVVSEIKAALLPQLSALKTKNPLTALDWQELMPGLRQSIEMDLVSGIIFYFILILVVAFSILNTFLMAILERTREFGVMMAIGTTPKRLNKLVLTESLSLTAVGIGAGIIMGCLITLYFQKHGIDISGSSDLLSQYGITGRIFPKLTIVSTFAGPIAVLIITFFAALYPARKIKRLKPVEAMYHA